MVKLLKFSFYFITEKECLSTDTPSLWPSHGKRALMIRCGILSSQRELFAAMVFGRPNSGNEARCSWRTYQCDACSRGETYLSFSTCSLFHYILLFEATTIYSKMVLISREFNIKRKGIQETEYLSNVLRSKNAN